MTTWQNTPIQPTGYLSTIIVAPSEVSRPCGKREMTSDRLNFTNLAAKRQRLPVRTALKRSTGGATDSTPAVSQSPLAFDVAEGRASRGFWRAFKCDVELNREPRE